MDAKVKNRIQSCVAFRFNLITIFINGILILFHLIYFYQINLLNVEIGQFLYNLRRFADCQQVSIGKKTLDLLFDTVTFIQDELIAKAEVVKVPDEVNTNFLQELNPSHFELRRHVICLLCNVNGKFS